MLGANGLGIGRTLVICAALGLIGGCVNIRVATEARPELSSLSFVQFTWAAPRGKVDEHPLFGAAEVLPRVEVGIAAALVQRGYSEAPEAGLLLSYALEAEQKIDPNARTEDEEIRWGPGPSRVMILEGEDPEYEEIRAILELRREAGAAPLWRGVASWRFSRSRSMEKNRALIHDAFRKLVKQLPER